MRKTVISILLAMVPVLLAAQEKIPVPHGEQADSLSTGSTIVISGAQLEKYSSSDVRNILTAIAAGVEVSERFGGPGVSAMEHIGQYGAAYKTTVSVRGKSPMYMIDDIPVNIDETMLDARQIESVTIVRDPVEKAMYGPSAANGIIYIKTKTGFSGKRYLRVDFEQGVNVVDKFPEYVSGADYARLNNIARAASGLEPLYTRTDVYSYDKGDAYDLMYPNVDYRSMMLKNAMSYTGASVSSAGGSDHVKYNTYLGYTGEDDIFKIGPEARFDRVNINANLSVDLNEYVTARFGIITAMGLRNSPDYGYSSDYTGALGVTEFPDLLSDINTIPAISFPIYANNDEALESPWYAVSALYTSNPYANLTQNGYYKETTRKGLFNLALDVDLSPILPGLKSHTYAAFDATNVVRIGQEEDYAAYIVQKGIDEYGKDTVIPVQSGSHSVKLMSADIKLLDYFSNRYYLVQKFSFDRKWGRNSLALRADYMITKRSQKFITEHRREMNFGFGGTYAYDGKYIFQAALNEHGTYSLLKAWSFSPTVGAAWVVSKEPFMQGSKVIDYLKLRVQGGLLRYDSATSANRDIDNYHWDNSGQRFGPYSSNQWFGSAVSTYSDRVYASMLGNPNLDLELRKEFTAGVDAKAFGKRLNLSVNYYYSLSDGIITELQNVLPLVAGISSGSLWMNYNVTSFKGAELSFDWSDHVGKLFYRVGAWGATNLSNVIKVDEQTYADAYRSKVGYPTTAIWGLKYVGQFASDAEAAAENQAFDDELKAGDFKYQDMNGDGMIDDSDICVIGDTNPKLIYGLNLYLKYGNWDLTLTGTGRAFADVALTSSYFWNGWGDGNYSAYTMRHAGDPGAPRLTYYKVNNNFKTSTYWLRDGSFFKIQTLELGYDFPKVRLFVRANNLLTLSSLPDVDPESTSAGLTNYPLMKTFVGGVKLTF